MTWKPRVKKIVHWWAECDHPDHHDYPNQMMIAPFFTHQTALKAALGHVQHHQEKP